MANRSTTGSRGTAAEPPRQTPEQDDPTSKPSPRDSASAVRWSATAVIGRQAAQMLSALVLARILGPESYGVISAATVYVTLTTLLLDQGLAAALVQRPSITPRLPGAIATVNLLMALALGGITYLAAPAVADFFGAPRLVPLLQVLAVGLVLKGAAIAPRAMEQRRLRFRSTAVADIAGGCLGAAAGIIAALLGAGVWAMAWQVLLTDAVIAVCLVVAARVGRPNLAMRELRPVLPFSIRIFGSNGLAYLARNADNVLVGRFLGVASLAQYSMAYRVLVIPVQMIGQTVNRVSFPTFSRLAGDPARLAASVSSVTSLLAMAAAPPMLFVAVAAPELVHLVLGTAWTSTAPVLTVLALAGARETIFTATHSVMRASGAGRTILRYELVATPAQLTGIVVGLQFGLVGVALGVAAAGLLLTPLLMTIQRRLVGLTFRSQLRSIVPPVHASLWGAGAYALLDLAGWSRASTLLVGLAVYLVVTVAVLWLAHRSSTRVTLAMARTLFVRKPRPA